MHETKTRVFLKKSIGRNKKWKTLSKMHENSNETQNWKLKQQEKFKQNGGNKSFLKWTMLW